MNNYILLSSFLTRDISLAKISSCFIAQVSLSLKFDKICETIFHDIKSFFKLYLQDHSAVDYPANSSKRFLLYYLMIDYIKNLKYYIFSRSSSNNVSINKVFPCAEWLERESFDFFGIFYNSHPDLRRILTDYGFPSYALRKDFPVQGYFDLVYSIASKKIQFKEIEFQQSFRVFIKENPYK